MKVLEVASQKYHPEYCEIRAQKLNRTGVSLKEERVEAAKQGIENGAALRVLLKGVWGFASIGKLDTESLGTAILGACKIAESIGGKRKTISRLAPVEVFEDKVNLSPKKEPSNVSLEEKIDLVATTNSTILSYDDRIRSCTINYVDLTGTEYFATNEGTYIEQGKLYVWLSTSATAKEGGVLTSSRESIGSTSGYETFDSQTPAKIGCATAERAIAQLKAKPPKSGAFPAVLGPNVVGTFIHEAFGHLAEADLTLSGSVLADKLGKKIGSKYVTVYDDGTVHGAFGSFKYDDEGVPSQRTLLIKEGIVSGLMHNRETAEQYGVKPTGNARAEDFRVEPIIRMRNTFIEPRDCSFEELVEDVKFGYYFKSFRGGQANLDGTFQVGIQEAYGIVNGEIEQPVRDASISGNTLEILQKVDAVGRDFELHPGVCGKAQSAFVCDGGAHTRVKDVLVGGSA